MKTWLQGPIMRVEARRPSASPENPGTPPMNEIGSPGRMADALLMALEVARRAGVSWLR